MNKQILVLTFTLALGGAVKAADSIPHDVAHVLAEAADEVNQARADAEQAQRQAHGALADREALLAQLAQARAEAARYKQDQDALMEEAAAREEAFRDATSAAETRAALIKRLHRDQEKRSAEMVAATERMSSLEEQLAATRTLLSQKERAQKDNEELVVSLRAQLIKQTPAGVVALKMNPLAFLNPALLRKEQEEKAALAAQLKDALRTQGLIVDEFRELAETTAQTFEELEKSKARTVQLNAQMQELAQQNKKLSAFKDGTEAGFHVVEPAEVQGAAFEAGLTYAALRAAAGDLE